MGSGIIYFHIFSAFTNWYETTKGTDRQQKHMSHINSLTSWGRAASINHVLREQALESDLVWEITETVLFGAWCIQTLSHQPGHHPWQARVQRGQIRELCSFLFDVCLSDVRVLVPAKSGTCKHPWYYYKLVMHQSLWLSSVCYIISTYFSTQRNGTIAGYKDFLIAWSTP